MKTSFAYEKLIKIKGKKISQLKNLEIKESVINKGGFGQILEKYIGLNNTSYSLDFDDGDLKTNKTNSLGVPLETIFVTQIKSIFDDMLEDKNNIYENKVFKKIQNLLYVGVCKEPKSNIYDWKITNIVMINQKNYPFFYEQIRKDFYTICRGLEEHIVNTGAIHTTSGKFMQVRSKDSKPYHPIYSTKYKKNISNKNFAFYLMPKKFIDIILDN